MKGKLEGGNYFTVRGYTHSLSPGACWSTWLVVGSLSVTLEVEVVVVVVVVEMSKMQSGMEMTG